MKIKNIFFQLMLICVAITLSQLINYYLIDEIIMFFVAPSLKVALVQRLVFFIIIYFILKDINSIIRLQKKFTKTEISILFITYILILFILLFRNSFTSITSYNIIPGITIYNTFKNLDYRFISNFISNIIIFIPLPLFLNYFLQLSKKKNIIIIIMIPIILELIQLLAGRGVWDIDDIILNSIGGLTGLAILNTKNKKHKLNY